MGLKLNIPQLRSRLYDRFVASTWANSSPEVTPAFDLIRDAFHGQNLIVERVTNHSFASQLQLFTGEPPPGALLATYEAHFAEINPRAEVGSVQREGVLINDQAVNRPRELERHEFYNDFLAPQDLRFFAGCKIRTWTDGYEFLTLQRSEDAGELDTHDLDLLKQLLPDVKTLLALRDQQTRAADRQRDFLGAFPGPAACFDLTGCLISHNQSFEACLSLGVIGLEASKRISNPKPLSSDILACLSDGTVKSGVSSNGESSIAYRVVPMHSSETNARLSHQSDISCLVILSSTSVPTSAKAAQLAQIYGLTQAESQVAMLIACGFNTPEIMQKLDIARNTVRTQLTRIRTKMDARSQTDIAIKANAVWSVGSDTLLS
ncbi:MAG: helix-turn-helix transcriptional regulator [Pseudomonadota bacterium]